jgi:predicted transcriptional regulator
VTHVATQTHEATAYLKYPDWGMAPYQALAKAILGRLDGYTEYDDTIQDEQWSVRVNYSKSGFAPRDEDSIDADRLYEWDITCRGPDREKFSFNVSPRFPDQRHHETGDPVRLAWHKCGFNDTEGIDVEIHSSNVDIERFPSLLRDIFRSVMTHAGLDYNSRYFSQPPHAATSRITGLERYVRLRRDVAKKLAGGDLMMRILRLLADTKNAEFDLHVDNEEIVGKMHKAVLNQTAADELWTGHQLGKQLKHYLLKNPDSVDEDDPTYHPKFGVLFEKGKTHDDGAVSWSDRDHLQTELEQACINSLAWSDIPVRPDADVFVADDHFDPHDRDDGQSVEIYNDPTPQIEADQQQLLVRAVRDTMTDADVDILEALMSDGSGHARDIAAASGRSLSTIYRALDRLDGILETDNGTLSFVSRKFADELRDAIQLADTHVQNAAKRVSRILGREEMHAESGALKQWLDKYGADLRTTDAGELESVRIDTLLQTIKYGPRPRVQDVVDELAEAWANAGRDVLELRDVVVKYKTGPGEFEAGFVSSLR